MPARAKHTKIARRSGPIVVIGSINMDLVCRTNRLPRPGETLLGRDFAAFPGGKGANQAVAAARLGAPVAMVGRLGDDDFGHRLAAGLREDGVDASSVIVTRDTPSGVALILVDGRGENSIVVAPGANALLSPRDVASCARLIRRASVVVLQLEVPLATVRHAVDLCRRFGVPAILDPAPAPHGGLPKTLCRVEVLTPNEGEAAALLAARRRLRGASGDEEIARRLLAFGPQSVVLKLGERGSFAMGRRGDLISAGPFRVNAVDSTAAGDAFTAALAVGRREGRPLEESLRFANAAGALCAMRRGAQPSLPRREEVERLLARHPAAG